MQSDRSIEVAYVTKALAFAAAVMVALLFVLADAKPAHAVTLTVNSTVDPGTGGCNSTECTLREAINVSNGLPTTDTINFNIPDGPAPGLEVKTISPASALPTITGAVTINGYTQAGAVVNNATTNANSAVIKIELSGRRPNGSRLAASGLTIQASSCLVKGLSINRFGQHGVLIKSASNTLEGNFIGIDPGGTLDRGNGRDGVRIESSDNLIGGPANAAQNIISGNDDDGVFVDGESTTASGNVISNNHIGTDADAEKDVGNSDNGVHVFFAPGVVVGGTVAEAANTISGNLNQGVMILGAAATGNSVLRNSIFGNGSPGGLGIALNNDGVTANDNQDPDTGSNKLQNFPVITSASTTTVTGSLNSRPSKTFTIQFFSNPAPNFPTGFGEGETFLGEKTVTTNDRGRATFNFNTSVSAGHLVTATATDASGNTSEFSQALTVG